MNNYDVVMKLIGPVHPVGDSNIDNRSYENLKELTSLTEKLLTDICEIENRYKNNYQHSMKRASEHCKTFLDANGIHE